MQTSVQTKSRRTATCAGAEGVLERPRYFPRQLITPDDLALEATYFRKRLRLRNRLLHGWGVVCGAAVCPAEDPEEPGRPWAWHVKITPGYILGPYGDDIIIDCDHIVDLQATGVVRVAGERYSETHDPWCTEVIADDMPDTVYVAVRYKEVMARLVRAQPAGCGCDETPCEYSRWQDGYEVGILTECPPGHQKGKSYGKHHWADCPPEIEEKGREEDCRWPACPPCPDSPWVVLAKIDLAEGGYIRRASIDNCYCRRVVKCSSFYCPENGRDEQRVADATYAERVETILRDMHAMREEWQSEREAMLSDVRAMRERTDRLEKELAAARERESERDRADMSPEELKALLERLVDEDVLVADVLGRVDPSARDARHAVLGLPAHRLHGLSENSTLGTWLKGKTIGDVATMVYSDIRPDDVADMENEARIKSQFAQVTTKARSVAYLVS
jgi:hypothetical protein